MSLPLDNTVALVTGASSGIGAATAKALAALGAKVALVARRADRLDELANTIRADGGEVIAVPADLSRSEEAAAAVERSVAEFGRLDTVVNAAGVMLLGPIEGAPIEEWERMIDINLRGALYLTHAALPHLLTAAAEARGAADIVMISSVAGRQSRTNMGVYNLTKHGLGAFSESLRQEVSGRHVRVSLVEPGPVATELFSHIRPEVLTGASGSFGTNVLLQAEDIADAVSYIVTRPSRVVVNEILVRPDGSN